MKVCEQNFLRKRVFQMLGEQNKSCVLKHFVNEGFIQSTIYSMISRFNNNNNVENKKKSGKKQF